jgi:hypothetical protein
MTTTGTTTTSHIAVTLAPDVAEAVHDAGPELVSLMVSSFLTAAFRNPVLMELKRGGDQTEAFDAAREVSQNLARVVDDRMAPMLEALGAHISSLHATRSSEVQSQLMAAQRAEQLSQASLAALQNQVADLRSKLALAQQYNSLMSKQAFARGEQGEELVRSVIADRYTDAVITDMGKSGTHQGDLHVLLGDGSVISIEVKHASKLDAQQVRDSCTHAHNNQEKYGDSYLGHLFVSLNCLNIPGHSAFELDWKTVQGGTTVWLGMKTHEGNDHLILQAFQTIRDCAPLHRELARLLRSNDAEEAARYKELLHDMQARAGRLTSENEALVQIVAQSTAAKDACDQVYHNLRGLLKLKLAEFGSFCVSVGLKPTLCVSGDDNTRVLRALVPGFEDASSKKTKGARKVPNNKNNNNNMEPAVEDVPTTKKGSKRKASTKNKQEDTTFPGDSARSTTEEETPQDQQLSQFDFSWEKRDCRRSATSTLLEMAS